MVNGTQTARGACVCAAIYRCDIGWIGLADHLFATLVVSAPAIVIVMIVIAVIKQVYVIQPIVRERARQRKIAPRGAEFVCVSGVIKRSLPMIVIVDPPSFLEAAALILKVKK